MTGFAIAVALLALAAGASTATPPIDASCRRAVLEAAAAQLEQTYVFPDVGRRLGKALRADARTDRFASATHGEAFADAVTQRLRALSGDGHLGLNYTAEPIKDESEAALEAYNEADALRWYGPQINHGFKRIERLDGNIGLLELTVFAPPAMAGDVGAAAMTLLAQSDALIIDLRGNGGGDGAMVQLLAAYLFDDEAQPMSGFDDRRTDKLSASTTPAWVPGRRYGGRKPVYILTSKRTFSAAEAFAYDLQALRRATIVGEPSGGGAHPFEYSRIHPHFALNIVQRRSLNPITGTNWQGTAVAPDVRVPAERALETALELARAEVAKGRAPAASDPRSLP